MYFLVSFGKLITLLRIKQWSKNLLIFLPLFFGGQFQNLAALKVTFITFIGFSFIASAIYCLNDILDKGADSLHPIKKKRPVASGEISILQAFFLFLSLMLIGLGILAFSPIPLSVIWAAFIYIFLNIAYCLKLKYISILDVIIVAISFNLRLVIGGFASNVPLSHWIILMTFLLGLFLGYAKRLGNIHLHKKAGLAQLNGLKYNIQYLNLLLTLTASMTIVCYIMYTVSPEVSELHGSNFAYLTSIFVIAGIFRYLQLAIVDNRTPCPTEILLRDRFIQTCLVLWILSFVLIIYIW
ncbi:UbiA prenyltransferase family protein [Flagellimonas sp.]|uniref:UbiA prenyltransferase family protein n=1 Tax=Flagellimonas sp. TaxID=2058762 RepID=UPI003B512BE8